MPPLAGKFKQGAFRRLVNLGLLIGGFGLGQGSIFLAQSYLVARGDTGLLALFGTHFSFAMLAIVAVEAGSLTVMARQIARSIFLKQGQDEAWRCYWETTVFRLCMAIVLTLGFLGSVLILPLPAFSIHYLLFALPGLFAWAFNAAGFLDGLQKSGLSGLSGSIAYLASAIALFAAVGMPPDEAGRLTGAALSIGYGLTVAVQFAALLASGWRPLWVRPSAQGLRQAFAEEGSMLAGLLPGQLYFRAQLTIASLFLGLQATALLVYAKQVVGAASQVAGFARRIEFPRLVEAVAAAPHLPVRAMLSIQKASFAVSFVLAAAIIATGFVIQATSQGFANQAWSFLMVFSVTIVSESVGQALVQGLFAHNRYPIAAAARIGAVSFAILLSYLVVERLGITAFVLSDLASHAIVVSLSLWWLRRHGHVRSS